ncbi:MAG: helix-turn-helix domain-containing protein [Tepidisphaerales bacterium]
MNKPKIRPTVAQRIAQGMAELGEAMRSGKPLHELFTVRTVEVPDPPSYDAKSVRKLRDRFQVSQAVFARLLGVSAELVEHWEQGICMPRPVVRRLLEEISRNPADFLARHIERGGRRLAKAG